MTESWLALGEWCSGCHPLQRFAIYRAGCDHHEIVDDSNSTCVEVILAGAPIAGARSLPVAVVREPVLDLDSLPKLFAAGWCLHLALQLLHQLLVGMDGDGSTGACLILLALRTRPALGTALGGVVDRQKARDSGEMRVGAIIDW